jgi:hypothetical protein
MIHFVQTVLAISILASASASASTTDAQIEQGVRDVLIPMTHFIESADSYTMNLSISNDGILDNGQKVELGSQVTVSIQKPGKARIEYDYRNGERAEIMMDGTTVAVVTSATDGTVVYDTAAQPGDIGTTLQHLSEILHTQDQLKGFFSIDFSERLHGLIHSGRYLGVANLEGIPCDNLAMRSDDFDIQLWVRKEHDPLPHRLVVYYMKLDGQPGFRVDFKDWNFVPEFGAATFDIEIPPGAKRIKFFPAD